jgi:hypothetical protein
LTLNKNDINLKKEEKSILFFYIEFSSMEKVYRLQNILQNIIKTVKKQDFLVYFRKISIMEIKEDEVIF